MAQAEITGKETLYQGRTTLTKITYETGEKENKTGQTREVLEHANAASCLLYNPQAGTVLLTRQFRIASFINGNPSGMLLETPAGLLEEGEEPAETMKREIEEETGYKVVEVRKIYEAYSSPGSYTELLHLYVAEYRKEQQVSEGGGLKEEGEDIKLVELSFADALAMLDRGEVRDAKTIILLQYAALKGLMK